MLRALALVLILATPALADVSARSARRRLIAVSIPDELFISNHDVTFPHPALRVGYQAHPVMLVEAGLSYLPLPYGAHAALVHVGGRYLLTDNRFAPYGFARVGAYDSSPDEGDGGTYPFLAAGLGIELAARGGFAAWAEAGPGLASFEQFDERTTELALFVSVGLGYRF